MRAVSTGVSSAARSVIEEVALCSVPFPPKLSWLWSGVAARMFRYRIHWPALISEIVFYSLVCVLTTVLSLLIIRADRDLSIRGDEFFGVPAPPFPNWNTSETE
ncbi:hypothetical protein MTO96_047785 [Rhipicephalus appendiculatus]